MAEPTKVKPLHTIGKRKTAVARVWCRPGSGKLTVNRREFDEYFPRDYWRTHAMAPITRTGFDVSGYDIVINVSGGGLTGHSGAVRLGLARMVVELDEEQRDTLKKAGLFTRDPRMVERKKYGRKKARKRFQFSKR